MKPIIEGEESYEYEEDETSHIRVEWNRPGRTETGSADLLKKKNFVSVFLADFNSFRILF